MEVWTREDFCLRQSHLLIDVGWSISVAGTDQQAEASVGSYRLLNCTFMFESAVELSISDPAKYRSICGVCGIGLSSVIRT